MPYHGVNRCLDKALETYHEKQRQLHRSIFYTKSNRHYYKLRNECKKQYSHLKSKRREASNKPSDISCNKPADAPPKKPTYKPKPNPTVPARMNFLQNLSGRCEGWYLCHHCGAEMSLKYSSGPHPFHFLTCVRPGCNIDPVYGTVTIPHPHEVSPAVKRYKCNALDAIPVPLVPRKLHDQIPFFAVCPQCGLTHRAVRIRRRQLAPEVLEFATEEMLRLWTIVGFPFLQRCANCGFRTGKGRRWKVFGIYFDAQFHMGNEFDGYFGVV